MRRHPSLCLMKNHGNNIVSSRRQYVVHHKGKCDSVKVDLNKTEAEEWNLKCVDVKVKVKLDENGPPPSERETVEL